MSARQNAFLAATAVLIAAAAIGCEDFQGDDITVETSELNGTIVPASGPLTRMTAGFTEPNESLREQETNAYYRAVRIAANGSGTPSIATDLNSLTKFKTFYQFGGGNEFTTRYYNRGDLGIGREMHCVDRINIDNQIACFVRNFAAGADNTEFTFGLSTNIAFKNLNAGNDFATVAMVFRGQMPVGSANRVFFVVYNDVENISAKAPLDRHAISFDKNLIAGTPGVNFNLHIPSNCVACHGGQQYNPATDTQIGGLFLPFDLDQFEYEDVPGRTRQAQLLSFKRQNEIVRKVAALSSTIGTPIKAQLDKWYNNTVFQTNQTEVFENEFDSNAVPTGWAGFESIFRSVVRRSCRTCHVANQFSRTFDNEIDFRAVTATSITRICQTIMPHSLQSIREFWQSSAPVELEAYLRSVGRNTDADTLHNCGPGSVVTLDPPALMTVIGTVAL